VSSPELLCPIGEEKGSRQSLSPPSSEQEVKPEPPEVGERVFVETALGMKMGVVKFAGETQFQPGLWIGVALDRPSGKHNGTVQGVKYFKCKEKHGVFVRMDKLVRNPGNNSPNQSPRPSKRPGGVAPLPGKPRRSASGRSSLETRRHSTGVKKL
jgi:kinesin family protein 13